MTVACACLAYVALGMAIMHYSVKGYRAETGETVDGCVVTCCIVAWPLFLLVCAGTYIGEKK